MQKVLTNRFWYGIILNVLRRTQTPAGIRNGLVVQLVRTLACHARGRGFEPHPGRQLYSTAHAGMAQSVEHILGKDEVTSSILVTSSKVNARSQDTVDGHFGILGNIFQTASFFAVFSERMRSVYEAKNHISWTVEERSYSFTAQYDKHHTELL